MKIIKRTSLKYLEKFMINVYRTSADATKLDVFFCSWRESRFVAWAGVQGLKTIVHFNRLGSIQT